MTRPVGVDVRHRRNTHRLINPTTTLKTSVCMGWAIAAPIQSPMLSKDAVRKAGTIPVEGAECPQVLGGEQQDRRAQGDGQADPDQGGGAGPAVKGSMPRPADPAEGARAHGGGVQASARIEVDSDPGSADGGDHATGAGTTSRWKSRG